MTLQRLSSRGIVLPLIVLLIVPPGISGQQPPTQAPPPPEASASSAALDNLVGPIALYPDALIAQILEAAKDFGALQAFSGWLNGNSALKGTQLQDAAQQAGHAACYIALAPFPQVVQMMVEHADWTKQLGAAFASDESAVYQSVQSLRAAAMALGNLQSTPEQEVVTETTSSGETIILVQPANPQVVYVPVYDTKVVYVESAPQPVESSSNLAAAAFVGFTVGILIGASSNHYYYGPYAWHGGGAWYHHHAYHHRQDYYQDRYDYRRDHYEDRYENTRDYADDRRDSAQGNQDQRQSQLQSTAQDGPSQRQTAADGKTGQANQAQRQATAQANQTSRPTAQANQANRPTPSGTSTFGSGQATSRPSGSSGSFSGYQSGQAARAQSSRGSASRSRGGGGRRR